MSPRAFALHYARVMLAECSRRRRGSVNRDFYWSLFAAAQRSRREAAVTREIQQGEMFA